MTDEWKLVAALIFIAAAVYIVARHPALFALFVARPTARCRDGSLSYSAHRCGTCSSHDGVSEWFVTDLV